MKNIPQFLLTVFILTVTLLKSQTVDNSLTKKYWDYKQKFLKNFIRIGDGNVVPGSGLPINNNNFFRLGEGGNYTPSDILTSSNNYYNPSNGRLGVIKQG